MEEYIYLYKITNLINDKIYIGIHKTYNLEDCYMGSGILIKQAIKKYKIENFKKEILYFFNSYEEAYLKEKEIVNENFINRKDTYNIAIGGKGSFDYINKNRDLWDTKLFREIRSNNIKLNWKNKSLKEKQEYSYKIKNRYVSDNYKNKIKQGMKSYWENKLNRLSHSEKIKEIGNRLEVKIKKSESLKKTWNEQIDRKNKLSQEMKGYNNRDFLKRWKPFFEKIEFEFLSLCKTSIPDILIQKYLINKYGINFKFDTCLNYLIFKNNLIIFDIDNKYKFYVGECNTLLSKTYISKDVLQYKCLKENYLKKFNLFVKCNDDLTISDSMMYNYMFDFSFGSAYKNYIEYYKYLGLLKKESKQLKINIKDRFPNSQRKFAQKTIYYINEEYIQDYILITEENLNEQYKINFDGRFISYCRI